MTDAQLTKDRIEALLRFLPALSEPGRSYFAEDIASSRYPIYTDDVIAFFTEAGRPWWADYNYNPREAGPMLLDDARVAVASLEEVKSMLTYCVRCERFCDGAWGELLKTGRVAALLRRIEALTAGGGAR